MITFFATGKPFEGHSGVIQRNALKSWKLLHRDVEVILFGDEAGVREICAELRLRHEPEARKHESGMKYLDYMFRRAQEIARNDFLCYSNCDIVQFLELIAAMEKARAWRKEFLLVGRRWDTDVTDPVDFADAGWQEELKAKARTTGFQQSPDFIDFFVFPKGFYRDVPPLVVGRSYWDHWLVWRALQGGLPVVDASRYLTAVHQNHNYGYHPAGKQGTNEDSVAMRNLEMAGGKKHQRSLHDASHAMTKGGKIVRTPMRRFFAQLYAMRTKQGMLNNTFEMRKKLRLRRDTLKKIFGA